jgi:DNA-binding SARP family transcriptional activator
MIEYRILGSIEVASANRVMVPSGAILRTLLAAFLASSNCVLTVETLAQELWGTTPPPKMENALHAHISRLRRFLGKLEPGRPESRLATHGNGYRFTLSPSELDATCFLDALDAVRRRRPDTTQQDVTTLRRALELWRGPVFGGLAGGLLCQTAAAKYQEARIAALELLYEMEMELGAHDRVTHELTELVVEHPLNEHFCRLLMLALYRSGRQVEALNTYRDLRRRLCDALGVEPSPPLRICEQAILEHAPAAAAGSPGLPPPREAARLATIDRSSRLIGSAAAR